jgi:hypothetical protein
MKTARNCRFAERKWKCLPDGVMGEYSGEIGENCDGDVGGVYAAIVI